MRLDGISPLMIEGIYTMLIMLWITLGVVGMISIGNWIDAKLEAFYERRERNRALRGVGRALGEKVIELNRRKRA